MANEDHGHIALPKLYGAPAYARPPVAPVVRAERPIDPDDLPLESERTDEDQLLADQLEGREYASAAADGGAPASSGHQLRARPFSLTALTGRLLGRDAGTGAGNAGASHGTPAATVTFGSTGSTTAAGPADAQPPAASHATVPVPAPAERAMAATLAGTAGEGAQSEQAGPPVES